MVNELQNGHRQSQKLLLSFLLMTLIPSSMCSSSTLGDPRAWILYLTSGKLGVLLIIPLGSGFWLEKQGEREGLPKVPVYMICMMN